MLTGGLIGIIAFVVFTCMSSVASIEIGFYSVFFFIIPALIVSLAMTYAGHRYLFRLRLWSEKHYGIRKEKEKRDISHLEENFSQENVFEEDIIHEDNLKQ